MRKRNPLASAVHYALGAGALAGLALTGTPAFAQDQEGASLEQRVQVTGSRIKRVDVETTSPVTVVTSEQILASGLANVGDVLRNLNQADSLGLSNLTSSTNANDGTQTVSLRGLGSQRTLILVNGRRWLGLGGGQVDITQIPVALVERIEVLGDGASAIYGSDAIAGVINIITRNNYDGLEVEMSMGSNFEGDGETRTMGATLGVTGTRSAAYLNVSATTQTAIGAGDRFISSTPIAFVPQAAGSAFSEYGIFYAPSFNAASFIALNPAREQVGMNPATRIPQDFQPIGPATNFNFAPENYLLTPSDRFTAFTGGHFDLTDTVRMFGMFTYNQRKSQTAIASVPLTVGFSGPQWVMPYSAQNVYNPFGETLTQVGFRMTPLGPRTNDQNYDTYFGTAGLEGVLALGDRTFDWDFHYSRGESSRYTRGTNYVNLLHLRNAMGPSFIDTSGTARCGTPTSVIVGCVPVNFFNGVSGVTQSMANYLRGDLNEQQNAGLVNWGVNVTGGLFDLPAGELAFAAGYERRVNTWTDTPDSLIVAGLSSTNFREPTRGEQAVDEFYAEFSVPLLRDMPGAQMLDLTLAARTSDYDNTGLVGQNRVTRGFDNTSLKFGLLYQPFEDLLFRATRSDTFRAPPVTTLFGGGGESFNTVTDPCASTLGFAANNPYAALTPAQQALCHANGVPVGGTSQATAQLRNLVGGNPFANPEEGKTTVIGVVYNPSWLNGLDLSLDYFKIELGGALITRGPSSVLNGCYGIGTVADPNDCTFIERTADGRVETLRRGAGNLGAWNVKGADFNANYRFSTDEMGSFTFRFNATWTDEVIVQTSPTAAAINTVGRADGPTGPAWRLRSNLSTTWNYGDYNVTWSVRHLSRLNEVCSATNFARFAAGTSTRQLCSDPNTTGRRSTHMNDIGTVFYHDLSAGWQAPWDATIRFGLRNMFRKDPPLMYSTFANSFDQAYDIPGGFWFLSYRQSL